jgi:hypothetical protein
MSNEGFADLRAKLAGMAESASPTSDYCEDAEELERLAPWLGGRR